VQGYTRHQLKQDRFAETAKDAAQWTAGHRRAVAWAVGLVLFAVAGYFGFNAWSDNRSEKSNAALGAAMRTLLMPLRPANTPPGGDDKDSFANATERARAANKQFKAVADQYDMFPYPKPAKIARYMEGVTSMQAGDNAAAEKQLKAVSESRDKSIAALGKMALAQLYRNTGRQSDAARVYKDVQEHPADTVSKAQAQLAMAEMYEQSDPQQAATLYQQIKKDNPGTIAEQIADARLASVK